MDINGLNSKWESISKYPNHNGFKSLRISSECIPDLFIATDEDGYRCLLLFLPANIEVRLKGSDKEKLKIEYIKSKHLILIKLNDFNFIDLFNDLILSLYSKIRYLQEAKDSSEELIYSFYKWAEFFEDRLSSKLSIEEIRGLFGELFVLKEFLEQSNISNINDVLDSWKGPYDTTNDFIFDKKNIEIKTKETSKSTVRISSEFQLEQEFDKGLELLVVSILTDLVNGKSIFDLLNDVVQLIRNYNGDLSILYRALNQKGITIKSSKEYNNYRFIVTKINTYNCGIEGFPKLSVSDLPNEITNLKYNLRTNTLDSYLIDEKKY
jgi:hypothetical protein